MKNQVYKYRLAILAALLPALANAAEAETVRTSYFSNALFVTLLFIIVGLAIVIAALGKAFKSCADSGILLDRYLKKKEKQNNTIKPTVLIPFFLFLSFAATAGTNTVAKDTWRIGGVDMYTFYSLLTIILLELIVISILYSLLMGMIKTERPEQHIKKEKTKTLLDKINASKSIEEEETIAIGHEYDGISELDNDLPPWWKYGFYLTIGIAVVYLIHYHVTKTGDLQTAEYNKSVAEAKAEIEAYMKTSEGNVDETTVVQLEGAEIESGKEIFNTNCAACHGNAGQGTVGPNLTDPYWLHGGGISDIFKSIKYGWTDKGMKAWKDDFSPKQIAQLASYIRTLKGSNPAGAKEPQGELYSETKTLTDSLSATKDTIAVAKDSIK
jgi:cytochrome c oxidase cbb3-type subunit III